MKITTKEAVVKRELLVGSYISRKSNRSVRVVRLADTHTYRGYVDGTLVVEGQRNQCMKLAHS